MLLLLLLLLMPMSRGKSAQIFFAPTSWLLKTNPCTHKSSLVKTKPFSRTTLTEIQIGTLHRPIFGATFKLPRFLLKSFQFLVIFSPAVGSLKMS
jgi:hypothetical protein